MTSWETYVRLAQEALERAKAHDAVLDELRRKYYESVGRRQALLRELGRAPDEQADRRERRSA